MLLRPVFIIAAVILFSVLNGWALIYGLRQNNALSSIMAMLAIVGTFYFVHLYQQLQSTPPDESESDSSDLQ